MSALENIRKHPGLVISVLGFAIVLFIITAVVTGNPFAPGDSIVSGDINTISYSEVQNRVNRNNNNQIDAATQQQQAVESLIQERLLQDAISQCGINVTDEELSNLISLKPELADQLSMQYAQMPSSELYAMAQSNSPEAANAAIAWEMVIKDLRNQLAQLKYTSLLSAIKANKIDAQAIYDDDKNVDVTVARLNYAPPTGKEDDPYAVSDQEIRDRYEQDKARYALAEPKRTVDYILVQTTPSDEDFAAAQTEVEDVVMELRNQPALYAVDGKYEYERSNKQGALASLPANVRSNITTIESDTVYCLPFNASTKTYTIFKLLDAGVGIEKAYINIAYVNTEELAISTQELADSLNNGAEFATFGTALQGQNNVPIEIYGEGAFASVADYFINSGNDYTILDNADVKNILFGNQDIPGIDVIIKVDSLSTPEKIYNVATVTRRVLPSQKTLSELNAQLTDYIAKNGNAKAFKESAAETQFAVESGSVTPAVFAICNAAGQPLPSTAQAACWALNNKKGDVSTRVYTDQENTFMLAVAINDVYEGGYTPVNDPAVTSELRAILRAEKQGKALVAEYQGKGTTVEEYAKAMNTTAIPANINFGNEYRFADPEFLAAVETAEKGKVVGPIAGDNGVYVFQVNNVEEKAGEFDLESNTTKAFRTLVSTLNLPNILRAGKSINYEVDHLNYLVGNE